MVAPEILKRISDRYDEGRYHAAWEEGAALGALREWPGAGRLWAARLASRLGAPRLSQALIRALFRQAPREDRVAYYHAVLIFARRGPWHGLMWLRDARSQVDRDDPDVIALEGRALAQLRDFDRARERIDEAQRRAPTSAWIRVERAIALELEDRVDDALASCDDALALRPHYRPALHHRAHMLASLGRREEALALLGDVPYEREAYELLSHRAELAHGARDWAACERDLSLARSAAALAEKRVLRDLASREAEALYLGRRHRDAEARAREADTPFARRFAGELAKLADGAAPPRVELSDVPHIRQHHVTCAPASIAQITAFHGDPVDHLELAETICYAGTPAHVQRTWAEARGYAVREFDLTLEATRALVDAGLPFVLTTAWTAAAHAQVVIGYDLARRSILIRDPSVASLLEHDVDELLKTQAWNGPRAMVLAPRSRADALAAIELPAAPLWDLRHRLHVALDRHDLAAAQAALDEMATLSSGSQSSGSLSSGRHVHDARLAIAAYRERAEDQLGCLDALLALHPGTGAWVLRRGSTMRGRRPRSERLAFWTQHARLDDPPFLEAFAEELRFEGARQDDAARLLRRALRLAPASGMAHHVYADLGATRGDDDLDVLERYRFAVTTDVANEHFARAYFDHARRCGRDDDAISLLERRVRRAGARASGPARTLFEVHLDQGNPERGLAALAQLADERPDDGDLATTLVHASLDTGDLAAARGWFDRSAGSPASPVGRALAEARLARAEGALPVARAALERAFASAPERADVAAEYARAIHELEGTEAAIAVLSRAREQSPTEGALLRELCVWLRGHDEARAQALLEGHLRDQPDDLWSRRELALVQAGRGDLEGGIATARAALAQAPHDSWACSVLGGLLDRAGKHDEARAMLLRAVELEIDNTSAMQQLAARVCSPEQRREDARHVLDLLEVRVSGGAGLIEASYLAACLPHAERGARLARLLERAPHRPDAWEAVARARMEGGDLDGAEEISRKARERFPRWLSLRELRARILRLREDGPGAERELRELCAIAPTLEGVRVQLSALLEERGAQDEALAIIDEGLARAPRSVALHREKAALTWNAGRRDDAFASLRAIVEKHFGDASAFDQLCGWSLTLGRVAEVEALLRAEHEADRESPVAAYRLGMLLTDPARAGDRITALRDAIARAPRHAAAMDLLAEALAIAGRFDEAMAACTPPSWGGALPLGLRGRRAWVLWRRGEAAAAIDAMKQVVEDEPDYAWGRRHLCDWLDESDRVDEFVEQARAFVAAVPTVASSHVYLGDACVRRGDGEGAIASFQRAVALAPDDAYAASRLVETLLAAQRIEEARATLPRLRHTQSPATVAKLEVDVETRAGRRDAALGALDGLLATHAPQATIEAALDALAQSPFADAALARVEDQLARADATAGVSLGWAWSNVRERHRPQGALRLFARRDRLGAAGRAAAAGWIEVLAVKRSWWALAWIALRHRAWLRAGDETWGAIGYALNVLGWHRATARWMRDWRERGGATATMLYNLVAAYWSLGRAGDAADAVQRAVELPPDSCRPRLEALQAFHHALAGRTALAEGALGGLGSADGMVSGMAHLTRAVLSGLGVSDACRADDVVAAVHDPLERAAEAALAEPMLRAPYRAAVEAILASRSTPERWLIRDRLPRLAG